MLSISTSKKAQIWYADLIISLLIFVATLTVYYSHTYNTQNNEQSSMQNIVSDAKAGSAYLAGPGYPENWNSSSVAILGLTDGNGRVQAPKLEALSSIPYSSARSLLNTKYDFFLYFAGQSDCLIEISSGVYGYGHPDANLAETGSSDSCPSGTKNMTLNLSGMSPEKVIRISRLVILNSSIANMVIHEWQ